MKAVISEATNEERLKIRFFLLSLFDKCDSTVVQSVMADSELSSIFSEAELRESITGFDNDDTNIPDVIEFEQSQSKKMKLMGSWYSTLVTDLFYFYFSVENLYSSPYNLPVVHYSKVYYYHVINTFSVRIILNAHYFELPKNPFPSLITIVTS